MQLTRRTLVMSYDNDNDAMQKVYSINKKKNIIEMSKLKNVDSW